MKFLRSRASQLISLSYFEKVEYRHFASHLTSVASFMILKLYEEESHFEISN